MNGKILQFVPRARRDRGVSEAANVFRLPSRLDDLTMDHVDTAPCEYIGPRERQYGEDEPA
jgi:hypothetical protein